MSDTSKDDAKNPIETKPIEMKPINTKSTANLNTINESTDTIDYEQILQAQKSLVESQIDEEFLPAIFKGIQISSFGDSRHNPFMKLKDIALNPKNSFYDRTQAVRYMNRIPHIQMISNVLECCISIINDEQYPIRERYFFFSNNEKFIKLDGETVKSCHVHYFKHFTDTTTHPILLRLLSAEYIYLTCLHTENHWQQAREFIIKCATDHNESVFIRSESSDVLKRKIVLEDSQIGDYVINELGNLYQQNRLSTIYTNAQNAHNETISESVMNIVRILASDPLLNPPKKAQEITKDSVLGFSEQSMGLIKTPVISDIYDQIVKMTDSDRKQKLNAALNHILIYPVKYEGICLSDILLFVWRKIQQQIDSSIKSELEKRLFEEMLDMDGTCGSGYLSRIVNVLTGFVQEENLQIKMNIKDQLRANIFGRLGKFLRTLSLKDQDIILAEIADESSKKETALEFLGFCSVKEELEDEFVKSKLIDQLSFDEIYKSCSNDFVGIQN